MASRKLFQEVSEEDIALMHQYKQELAQSGNKMTPEILAWVNKVGSIYSKAAIDKVVADYPYP